MITIRTATSLATSVAAILALASCGAQAQNAQDPLNPDGAAATLTVTVSPVSVSVAPGGTQAFAAAVTGSAVTKVTWSIQEGTAGGSVSEGLYTAPSSSGVYHVVVASVVDGTKTATATVNVSPVAPVPSTGASLGTNLNWVVDWDPEKLPADLVWSARPWALGSGNGDTPSNWAPVDSQGWPVVPVGTTFGAIFEGSPWAGTYKLSFKNRQGTSGDTVTSYSGNIQLQNRQHNSATNVTTYDVVVPSYVYGQFIWLRWAGSTGGVTDVHLMRPLKDGSGWHAVGTPLSDHIIDRLKWFTTIRVAQTMSGESGKVSGTDSVWSGRTKPWGPQTRSSDPNRKGGVAIENLVAMANQAQKDLWINVPFNATDDYILKMAQVIRYGSDGANPYTSDQVAPVFAPLSPALKVYVEHGNEIWNSGLGYWEAENEAADAAERAAGDRYHTGYKPSGSGVWGMAWRRVGYLAVRHSTIFRSVFGDAAMMTRVRPVIATQHGRYGTTDEPLNYIRDVWGQGYSTTVPYGQVNEFGNVARPVNYYLYALATAPYIPTDNSVLNPASASTLIDGIVANLNSTTPGYPIPAMAWNRNISNSLGIQYVTYEGGDNLIPDLMAGGPTASNIQNAKDASYDPILGARMGAAIDGSTGLPLVDQSNYVYGRVLSEWAKAGGSLFMHYTLGQSANAGGMFGLCAPSAQASSDCRSEAGPKWDAIKAYSKAWSR